MAAWAAARTGSGTGKCGWPMLRLIGSLSVRPSSKIFRTPDISMARARSAIQCSVMGCFRPLAAMRAPHSRKRLFSPFKHLVRPAAGLGQLVRDLFEEVLDVGHLLGPLV